MPGKPSASGTPGEEGFFYRRSRDPAGIAPASPDICAKGGNVVYKNLMKVGEVAEIANISKKQLRRYDQMGVFCPAYKDPDTGYRYYTEDQLREIFLVRDLRFYGMPMNEIATILTDCHNIYDVCRELERHQRIKQQEIARMQHELSQTSIQLARIREALLCEAQPGVQRVYVDPFHALYKKMRWDPVHEGYRVSSWEISDLVMEAREKRLDAIDNFVILHGDYMRQFDYNSPDCSLDTIFGWIIAPNIVPDELDTLGGFEALSMPATGTDEMKEKNYRELLDYARANQIELDDFCMERHILGSSIARGYEKRVIRIYLPIKKKR